MRLFYDIFAYFSSSYSTYNFFFVLDESKEIIFITTVVPVGMGVPHLYAV